MKTITLAEYRQLEPTLTRPLTDKPRERSLPDMYTPQPASRASDVSRLRWKADRRAKEAGK